MNILAQLAADDASPPEGASVAVSPDEPSGWDRATIAGLSRGQISFLPDETLAAIIDRACKFLPQPEVRGRLCYLDRESLERLVYLVRQAFRQQADSLRSMSPGSTAN